MLRFGNGRMKAVGENNGSEHQTICSNMLKYAKMLSSGELCNMVSFNQCRKEKCKRLLSHYFQRINYVKSIVMINLHDASEAKIL